MSDPFIQPNNGPAPASAEEANQQRQDRVNMVEEARRVGEAQRITRSMPSVRTGGMDYAQMAPPGTPNPEEYVRAMIEKGGGQRNAAQLLDTSKMTGALPVDSSILNECRSPMGFACSAGDLKPDGTVSYKGLRMTAAQAVKEGLLEDNGRGGFQLPSGENVKAREDAAKRAEQQAKATASAELAGKIESGDEPDAEAAAEIARVAREVPAPAQMAIIRDAVSTGQMSEANVVAIGASIGLSAEASKARAEAVWNGLHRQASAAIRSAGVPAAEVDAVLAYASQQTPGDQKNAVLALALTSDASAFRAIAKKYAAWKRNGGQ